MLLSLLLVSMCDYAVFCLLVVSWMCFELSLRLSIMSLVGSGCCSVCFLSLCVICGILLAPGIIDVF